MSRPYRIEPLSSAHPRQAFSSDSEPLDRYFHRQVSQDIRRHLAGCFVAVDNTTDAIAGYYTLSATSLALRDIPQAQAKRLPSYPNVPAALLGRLAVSQAHQGQGLGGVLLVDALRRTYVSELGVYAMLVDAKDEAAQAFYEHYGFISLPLDDGRRRLFLPMATAKQLFLS